LLVPPLAEAMKVSIPILALVQDVPLANRDRNAFQEFDHVTLFASVAKWVRRLDDPSRVDEYLDMAISAACSGRPGPTVLLLPRDLLGAPVVPSAVPRRAALGTFPQDRTRPPAEQVERAAELLRSATHPIIIAGGGVHLSGASDAVAALQERASLPVATTTMGKGSVDETHPLSLGIVSNYMGQGSSSRHLREFVRDADVVLLVGTRTNENGTDAWRAYPPEATFIHIDVDGLEVGRNYESLRLVGDARLTLEDLLDALESGDLTDRAAARTGFIARIDAALRQGADELKRLASSDAAPVRPERIVAELDNLTRDQNVIVTTDASYSTIWMGNQMRSRHPGQRFLAPRGLAGLGWGVPLALGAQVADPAARVVALVGDGGFGHVWSELETAVRENLPVVVILLNNGILGFQKHVELVQLGAHTTATDFNPVDHAAIARACGAEAVQVTEAAEVAPALAEALQSGRPYLVEVICDPYAFPPITAWDGSHHAITGTGQSA